MVAVLLNGAWLGLVVAAVQMRPPILFYFTFLFQRKTLMNIAIEPLLALVVGILILIVPRFLNYFVAVYLIVVGILGLMHHVTLT